MTRYYTGVGHRAVNVSKSGEEFMLWLSDEMASKDIHLLSGDSDGSDRFFETNCDNKCKIFLPFNNFGHYEGRDMSTRHILSEPEKIYADNKLVQHNILPGIIYMPEHIKNFHRRNFYQVWNFGNLPEVCFYYAKEIDGVVEGGTRTAVYTARHFSVPRYNLFTEEGRDVVKHLMEYGKWD